MEVKLVLSSSSPLSSFSSFFLSSLSSSSCPLLLCLYPCVYYYHHSSSPPSPFCSSSCPPYCYCFSSIFVDSFLADVNECTSPTPVCGIHFNCINTLGSYRCEYNYRGESCQSKKSMNYLFLYF